MQDWFRAGRAAHFGFAALATMCLLVTGTEAGFATCGMALAFRHPLTGGASRDVYASDDGSLLYIGPLAINHDGAPNAYHPDGRPAGALDTICNGADAILPDGRRLRGYQHCSAFLQHFAAARRQGWLPTDGTRIEWYGVATRGDRGDARFLPCIQDQGSWAGFFVAQTAILADPARDRCDPGRYLDASALPFFVLPRGSRFFALGVTDRTVGIAFDRRSGRRAAAIYGDVGPARQLGEGSLELVRNLRGLTSGELPAPFGHGITVLVFPRTTVPTPVTAATIAEIAQQRLNSWGGAARLQACADELLPTR